ncbi:ribosome biogenesis GTPase YqeH [Limosilactobacillus coleohominis]|uniref:Ribosome biogenesis GTPase YqeH n=1 Tax=Limosilactobacillus coleohominis TaxID=181675 RepID=A0ABS2GYS9_9LACO|nr:ribosome biogenesis GTPase YqeH [Limosilactobacillus coleohominis]MBM6940288.1 ribosome biogenesis GTPase YqeH [Limosilactobacillus coleohominis]MBM6955034.1 ribosome biogenesis GTPase YqeH [Limosilactobacillus coleohominis]
MTEQETTNEELRCIGCGAVIQSEDPKEPGYTPQAAIKKGLENNELYCQRCFRLRHYNEIAPVSLTDDDFLQLLNHIRDANALIVYVVDIFDFNGSLIPGLHRFVGDNPVLLVGNKEDLLPRSLRRSRLRDWIRQQANLAGIRPIDTVLVSAKKNHQIEDLLNEIEKYRHHRDVYVVGVTNVGKSTLINQIIKQRTGVQDLITTSRFPGTTLDKIEIPLDDGHELVDTPGIIHQHQMAHVLPATALKLISPQKEIKPRTYQLSDGQTIFLGGIGRFDYLKGPKVGVVAYFDNNLNLHRTKLSNADHFYQKHLGELLTPPTLEDKEQIPPLERFEFSTSEKTDLVFEGLGWITVPKGIAIAGWAPKGVRVLTRRAMI